MNQTPHRGNPDRSSSEGRPNPAERLPEEVLGNPAVVLRRHRGRKRRPEAKDDNLHRVNEQHEADHRTVSDGTFLLL